MKTIILAILINIFQLTILFSQINEIIKDANKIVYLYSINDTTYIIKSKQIDVSKELYLVYKKDIIIDTININFEQIYFNPNIHGVLYILNKNILFEYNILSNKLSKCKIINENKPEALLNDGFLYYKEHYINEIPYAFFEMYSLTTGNKDNLIKYKMSELYGNTNYTYAGLYYSTSSRIILVLTGLDVGEGGLGEPFKGYIINLKNQYHKELVESDSFKLRYLYKINPFDDVDYYRAYYEKDDTYGNPVVVKNYVMNSNYALIRLTNPKIAFDIKGYSYINNQINGTYITSSTDRFNDKVVIKINNAERFDYIQNMIFNDKPITGRLDSLTNGDLETLKYFIFAKHNQKFDDEYYQAYFNTFVFYSDESMRKSRLSDVFSLLTETDNKNLEIINMQLLKYK